MKRLVIPCILILILALSSQAYALGSHHGKGGGGGSSGTAASSGTSNGAANNPNNSPTVRIVGGETGGENTGGGTTPNSVTVPTPEPTTMFLLGSALFGLWGLRRKIKK
jgi:hypothetical protein